MDTQFENIYKAIKELEEQVKNLSPNLLVNGSFSPLDFAGWVVKKLKAREVVAFVKYDGVEDWYNTDFDGSLTAEQLLGAFMKEKNLH